MQIHHPQLTQFSTAPTTKLPSLLQQIVWHKKQEVTFRSQQLPLAELENHISTVSYPRDFLLALWHCRSRFSLIAEVKKASPSKGVICADFNPVKIAEAYERVGAACISVLTDHKFFQGSFADLGTIRQTVSLPLLCKDFIIDPYQIYLARVAGADAILLIAALLSDQNLQEFLQITHSLGMNALVEVHTLAELDRVLALKNIRLVGINNRNLEDFTVDLFTTQQLMAQRREQLNHLGITVVSESGIQTATDLALVAEAGVHAVLVGESLIKQTDIEQALLSLLQSNPVILS